MPFKGHYRSLSYADMCQENSNQHHPDSNLQLQLLHHIFPISNDLPMQPRKRLLDGEPQSGYWAAGWSNMSGQNDHCRLNLRTWSSQRSCRLDTGHPTNLLGMELEHESSNQDLCGAHPSTWSSVRVLLPTGILQSTDKR
jgi:hypothetical protein